MTSKLLFVGDVHIADRPPLGRVEGYREQMMAKLLEVGRLAADAEVDVIVLLGDLFHQPRANLVSHSLVRELAAVIGTWDCRPFVIAGNHDLAPDGMDSLERQPLGVLDKAGVVEVLREPIQVGLDDPLMLFPRHYDHRRQTDPTYYEIGETDEPGAACNIVVAHGPLLPPGEVRHPNQPVVNVEDINLDGVTAIISGHLHEALGVHKLPNGAYFANPGSVGRVSRTPDNLRGRRPQLLLLTWDGRGVEFETQELESVLPPSEVFVVAGDGDADPAATSELREFAAALSVGLSAESVPLDELLNQYPDVSPTVKEHVRRLLVEAGGV